MRRKDAELVSKMARRATWARAVQRAVLVRKLPARAGRAVLLTFDDGPHPDVTPSVLERLDRYQAKAVFFVVGRFARKRPDVVRMIKRRGHLIGNHTHLHRDHYLLPGRPEPRFCEYYQDTNRCQRVLEDSTGQRPTLFRPPGGRLTLTTILVPRLMALRPIGWSRSIEDWRFRTTREAKEGGDRLATTVRGGDIVLLHDNNPRVIPLLDRLLPLLVQKPFDLSSAVRLL